MTGKSIRGSARTISGRDNIHALFAFGVSVSWLLHSTFFISTIAPWVGLARTIHTRCTYGIFGRNVIKYTVIYGVYIYSSGQP
jgi:hypothetical protein